MRGILISGAALLLASPASAQSVPPDEAEVILAVDYFMQAIGSADKTDLADHLIPDGVIYVHDRMDPDNPRIRTVAVVDHLARWATQTRAVSEDMSIDLVSLDGDWAHVVGPYVFRVEGKVSHCGINSLGLAKTADGWRVANTSFTVERPEQCAALGAPNLPPELRGQDADQ